MWPEDIDILASRYAFLCASELYPMIDALGVDITGYMAQIIYVHLQAHFCAIGYNVLWTRMNLPLELVAIIPNKHLRSIMNTRRTLDERRSTWFD